MPPFRLALVFTGHMVDLPDRDVPRFPPALESAVANAIRVEIAKAKKTAHGSVVGLASGARGGDILFLEACIEAGLAIRMVLPFEPAKFLASSVRGAMDGDWEKRFHTLWDATPPDAREILHTGADRNPYDVCNRRTLALAHGLAAKVRLIALWDGKDTDLLPGGTASFVKLNRDAGGMLTHIDSEALLRGLGQ